MRKRFLVIVPSACRRFTNRSEIARGLRLRRFHTYKLLPVIRAASGIRIGRPHDLKLIVLAHFPYAVLKSTRS